MYVAAVPLDLLEHWQLMVGANVARKSSTGLTWLLKSITAEHAKTLMMLDDFDKANRVINLTQIDLMSASKLTQRAVKSKPSKRLRKDVAAAVKSYTKKAKQKQAATAA